ncbi:hypothetical protein KAR91_78840 [Candidatus Pacearchaeota archaeon]|nr:hypothetical protein [Candidatus Pacearchaeota archaeon]
MIREYPWPYQVAQTRITAGGGGTTRTAAGSGVDPTALAAIQRAKAYYQPGGGFGKGVEAGLERGRVKAVSAGMQGLVGAGLAGTTMAGGLGKRYEEEVAAPARMGVEERRAQAISGIEMQQAGMGFQAGQAGLQRGFQAGESAASRSLQMYIANLQATLQRESMASRGPTMTAPAGGYAKQFPSIYGQEEEEEEQVPDWTGGGGGTTEETPWPTMAPFGGTMYGTQEAFETSLRR